MASLQGGPITFPRAREIDAALATAFDRLGRNLRHFLMILDDFPHLAISLISLREQFDVLSPIGRLVASLLAGSAEFGRQPFRERP